MDEKILVTKSSMPDFDEYMEEIRPLWESRWLTNMGAKHKELEKELISYLDVDNITLFVNGHLALECALAAFDLKGEVITTPLTFASTGHAIVRNGLEPVFCDVRQEDGTMDVTKIEALITDQTSAIVPVHVYGNICQYEAIEALAKKYDLKVIYDAAHAFGIKYKGLAVANFGDASMFSFHATKVYNTIEGGAVVFHDEALDTILYDLKNFGIAGPESVRYIGGNAKMNEFQAAMGLCNLRHIDDEIAKRQKVHETYRRLLDGVEGLRILKNEEHVKSNYAYMPVVFEGGKYKRDDVIMKLKEEGVFARKYFYPLVSDFECYEGRFDSAQTPVAKRISSNVLTLPIYADLDLKDVERICHIILSI